MKCEINISSSFSHITSKLWAMDVLAGHKFAEKRMRVENGWRLDQETSIHQHGEAELDCYGEEESKECTVELSQEHDHWRLIVHLHHWLDHSGWLRGQIQFFLRVFFLAFCFCCLCFLVSLLCFIIFVFMFFGKNLKLM